jgi:hypothetical protein
VIMDLMTFITEMTKALAWPNTVLALGILFRELIVGLFEGLKLKSLKKGEWLADFEAVATEVRAELPQNALSQGKAYLPLVEDHLISIAPVEAVLRLWKEIESKILNEASTSGLSSKNFSDAFKALLEIQSWG